MPEASSVIKLHYSFAEDAVEEGVDDNCDDEKYIDMLRYDELLWERVNGRHHKRKYYGLRNKLLICP